MYPVARQLGYDLLLGAFTPGRGQDIVVDELLRYRCAGLVVVGPELHARDLEPLAEEVAVVEVGRGVTGGRVDVIRNDDAIGTPTRQAGPQAQGHEAASEARRPRHHCATAGLTGRNHRVFGLHKRRFAALTKWSEQRSG
jgi:hypothetical protein